ENVLNQILRDCAVPGEPAKKAEQRMVVAVKEESQLSQVSVSHCEHQAFVGVLHPVGPSVKTRTCEKGYILATMTRHEVQPDLPDRVYGLRQDDDRSFPGAEARLEVY